MGRVGPIAVVLAATACAGGVTEPATGTSAPTLPESTTTSTFSTTTTVLERELIMAGDLTVIVPPATDGSYSPDQMVACSGFQFPFGALDDVSLLTEDDPPGVWDGIRDFLRDEEGQFWPQDGWYVLHETPQSIDLVAISDDAQMAHVTLRASDSDEAWLWSGASLGEPCTLEYATPPALGRVDWRLDPGSAPPDRDSDSIDVLVSERACAGGQEMGDRLVGPQVVMTPDEVRIAFAARPLVGAQTCQSNPESAVTVDLPVGLGSREVVVGLSMGIELIDYLD